MPIQVGTLRVIYEYVRLVGRVQGNAIFPGNYPDNPTRADNPTKQYNSL
jgi:hypothetical protein